MWYVVKARTSRSPKWTTTRRADTLDEAIDIARFFWGERIDDNDWVDVRIERKFK
jgi:hypothetical protein